MAVTINAKGTSVDTFTVGKGGLQFNKDGAITPPVGSDLRVDLSDNNALTIDAGTEGPALITSTSNQDIHINPAVGGGQYLVLNSVRWPTTDGTNGQVLRTNGAGVLSFSTLSGTGTVTAVSIATANGVSGSVATSDTTPEITLTLGDITPTSVAATGTVTGSNLSGTNTGDQTITLTGDVTGTGTGSFATTLATVNSSPQTDALRKITVNAKGLVTATTPASSEDIITALGYTPADAADNIAGNVTVSSLNSGQLAGLRNKIINGDMLISQRGTSFSGAVSGSYTVDRWSIGYVTSAGFVLSQQADVPATNEFQTSLRMNVTVADASVAAGDGVAFEQRVEGYNVRDLIGRTFTVSFWVRSSKTGVHCVSFRNSGSNRSYVTEYTVLAANTWEKKTVTVTNGLITDGTWNWTNGTGISVRFEMMSGTTYHTTPDAWQTGNFLATSNQVNCLDTVGNIFAITGVQLEVGTEETPFEHRPYSMELSLCQRYYQTILNGALYLSGTGFASIYMPGSLPVPLRASATTTFPANTNAAYNTAGGSATPVNIFVIHTGGSDYYMRMDGNGAITGWPPFGPIRFAAEL